MNIQQLFKRTVRATVQPHCNERDNRAEHMSKAAFIALLGVDALTAYRLGDTSMYNVVLDEIAYVDGMTNADYAFYCWQRASNAAYSYTADTTGNVQLSLF